jgi:hypothetical protein
MSIKKHIRTSDLKQSALARLLEEAWMQDEEREGVKKKVSNKEADDDRNELADLHAEKGDDKSPVVEDDDLPVIDRKVHMPEDSEEESEGEDKKTPPKKKKKPQPPFFAKK